MNIFVVSPSTVECAQALDDLRLNKMILETAQLLSTSMRENHYDGEDIYKSTHINHPCSIWARTSKDNYIWLLTYMNDLVQERIIRTGKLHKCAELLPTLNKGQEMIAKGGLTMWPNCTPFKHIEDVHAAYRFTMIDKWLKDKRLPTWKVRGKPTWMISETIL